MEKSCGRSLVHLCARVTILLCAVVTCFSYPVASNEAFANLGPCEQMQKDGLARVKTTAVRYDSCHISSRSMNVALVCIDSQRLCLIYAYEMGHVKWPRTIDEGANH